MCTPSICETCKETKSETLPATGEHDYQKDVYESKEAKCGEDGVLVETCQTPGCTSEPRITVLPATGEHEYEGTLKEATCTEPQMAGYFCKNCGVQKPDTESQEMDPALGHTEEEIKAVPATCTEAGKTAGKNARCAGRLRRNRKKFRL